MTDVIDEVPVDARKRRTVMASGTTFNEFGDPTGSYLYQTSLIECRTDDEIATDHYKEILEMLRFKREHY